MNADELTPAGMEAAARPFVEPCERRLREWAESDYITARVNRLDLKRVLDELDELRAELREVAESYANYRNDYE